MAIITDDFVANLQGNGKDFIVFCEKTVGFGVRVKPSGVKSYVAQFRDPSGTSKRAVIGKCDDMTSDQARELAVRKMGVGKLMMREIADAAYTGNTCIICAGFCPRTSTCRMVRPSIGDGGIAIWPVVSADDWCREGVFTADDF